MRRRHSYFVKARELVLLLSFFLSFFLYNVCFRFSITQQQLINKTLSFFYSYFFSLSLSRTLWILLLTCLRSLR